MPKRRGGSLIKGKVNAELSLGTLAGNTLLGGPISDTVTEKAFLLSADLTVSIRDHTAGEGPIHVGICHSDYSDTEVEEWFETQGSWEKGDMVEQEKARRKCRHIGTFPGLSTEEVLNDGNPIRVRCRWTLTTGQTLKIWAYNKHSGALTTGTVVGYVGNCWLKG